MNRYGWLLTAIALIALLAVACGGDDDDSESADGATATATATDDAGDGGDDGGDVDDGDSADDGDGDSSGDDDSGEPGDDGDGDDSGDGGGSDGLAAIAAVTDSLTAGTNIYKVTYRVSGSAAAGDYEAVITLSSDPPRSLMGIEGTLGEQDYNLAMIGTEEQKPIICLSGEGQQGQCLELANPNQSPLGPLPTFFDAPEYVGSFTNADGVTVRSIDGRTIAGTSADCYEVISPGQGEATVCISEDRSMLLSAEVDQQGNTFTMEVIAFGQPSGEDFEPPYPVTSLAGAN